MLGFAGAGLGAQAELRVGVGVQIWGTHLAAQLGQAGSHEALAGAMSVVAEAEGAWGGGAGGQDPPGQLCACTGHRPVGKGAWGG